MNAQDRDVIAREKGFDRGWFQKSRLSTSITNCWKNWVIREKLS
jgi:hypothetical protein